MSTVRTAEREVARLMLSLAAEVAAQPVGGGAGWQAVSDLCRVRALLVDTCGDEDRARRVAHTIAVEAAADRDALHDWPLPA